MPNCRVTDVTLKCQTNSQLKTLRTIYFYILVFNAFIFIISAVLNLNFIDFIFAGST